MSPPLEPQTVVDAAQQLAGAWASGQTTVVGKNPIGTNTSETRPLVVSLRSLTRVVDVAAADGAIVVEAGVSIGAIRDAGEAVGLWCPALRWLDASCLIGAAVAGGHGRRTRRYGAVGDYVQGMRFACPAFGLVSHGGKAIKNATGYNLSATVAGSRGDLGVILEIVLRLVPKPRERRTAQFQFQSRETAWPLIRRLASLDISGTEATAAVDAVETFAQLTSTEVVMLVELEGTGPTTVAARFDRMSARTIGAGGTPVTRSTWPPTSATPVVATLRRGVDPRTLPDCVRQLSLAAERLGTVGSILTEATGGSVEVRLSAGAEAVAEHLDATIATTPLAGAARLRARLKSAFDPNGLLGSQTP